MRMSIIGVLLALVLTSCGSGVKFMETYTYEPQKIVDSLTTANGFIMVPYTMWKDGGVLVTSDSTRMRMYNNEVRFKRRTYTISVLEFDNEKSIVRFRRR